MKQRNIHKIQKMVEKGKRFFFRSASCLAPGMQCRVINLNVNVKMNQ